MADLGIPPNDFYVAQFAQATEAPKRMNSAQYHFQLPRLIEDLKPVSALDIKVSDGQSSPVVKFMQQALNHLNKNKGAGEDGVASPAFVARVNQFVKETGLLGITSANEISGAHLAALIDKQKRGFLGSDNDGANRSLSEALRSIDNDRIQKWGGRFDPYPSTPAQTSQAVPGKDGKLAYNAQTNTLIIG